MSDSNQIRVDVLGVSVDESTGWTSTGPTEGRNVLNPLSNNERVVTRILNAFDLADQNTKNAADAFDTRFSTVIGAEQSTDQAAFQAIGANLIQAVRALQIGSGGGAGIGLHWGTSPPSSPSSTPFWWDTTTAQLIVWTTNEWVIAVNQPNLSGPGPAGPAGPSGPQGPQGPAGAAIPPGSEAGQVLMWTGAQWMPALLPGAPTTPTIMAVGISNDSFNVPTTASTPVGTLSATILPSAAWTGTFALGGSGADNAGFSISGSSPTQTLNANSGLSAARQYHLTVTATQTGLGQSGEAFPLTVTGQPATPGQINYSTTEQLTGLHWTDGNPIYQKTVVGTAPNNTAASAAHGISDLGHVVSTNSVAVMASGAQALVPDQTMQEDINATNVVRTTFVSGLYGGGTAHTTLRYTRTTAGQTTGTPDFSTTDTPTGSYWIDGKPIYRRNLVYTAVPSSTGSDTQTARTIDLTGIEMITAWDGIAVQSGTSRPIPQRHASVFFPNPSPAEILFVLRLWSGNADIYITMAYTKTTDPAGTPDASGVGNAMRYSTYEHPIGALWTDRRPIYRKVIVRPGGVSVSPTTFAHNIANIGTVVGSQIVANWGLAWYPLGNFVNALSVTATNISWISEYLNDGQDILSGTNIVLLYTRSTDSPVP